MPSNHPNERDRWQELAELLGLPPAQTPMEEPAPRPRHEEAVSEAPEPYQASSVQADEETFSDLDEPAEDEEVFDDSETAEAVESLEQHFLDEAAGVNLDDDLDDMPE